MYSVDKWSLTAGTAETTYYTVTATGSGESYADLPKDQADADFQKINFVGLVIAASYDDETKTREVTVDEKLAEGLTGKFGTVDASGKFAAGASDGAYPTAANDYAIEVSLGDVVLGTYNVTVLPNRVSSTAIYVADNYDIYTDGSALTVDGSTFTVLDGAKVYVTKTMTNGQVLKATADEVAWSTIRANVEDATATGENTLANVKISADLNSTTKIYAKYVGGSVTTAYTRQVMEESFTVITEAVSGVKISGYDVKLELPAEDTTYSAENPVTDADIDGITVTVEYNSGKAAVEVDFAKTASTENYTWRVALPTIGTKVAGDSVDVTINAYNTSGSIVASKTVSAVLVADGTLGA